MRCYILKSAILAETGNETALWSSYRIIRCPLLFLAVHLRHRLESLPEHVHVAVDFDPSTTPKAATSTDGANATNARCRTKKVSTQAYNHFCRPRRKYAGRRSLDSCRDSRSTDRTSLCPAGSRYPASCTSAYQDQIGIRSLRLEDETWCQGYRTILETSMS